MRTPTEGRWSTAIGVMVSARVAIPALVVIAALTLAACGGSSTAATSPTTTTTASAEPTPSATPLPTPTVAGTIAFARVMEAGSGGNVDIYVIKADGSDLKPVADGPGLEAHPSWSPHGGRIVYDVYQANGEGRFATVWIMNADGSGKTQLTKGSVKGGTPSWSPDGKRVVFMRNVLQPAERWVMYVVKPDGSGLKRVTHPPAKASTSAQPDEYFPTWAPNGKLLFLRLGDVFAVNRDGSGLERLTNGLNVVNYALSPDGRRLAVHEGTGRIAVIRAHGGGRPVTLLDPVSDFIHGDEWAALAWTPDGKAVTLASSEFYGSGSRVYIVNADGTRLSAVPGVEAALDPAWRPK